MKNYGSNKDSMEADGGDKNSVDIDFKLHKALEILNDENIQRFMEEGDDEELIFSEEHDQKIQKMVGENFGKEAVQKIKEAHRSRRADNDSETLRKSIVMFERRYTLGKTLEGYKLISEEIDDMRILREYQNNEQDTYRFLQYEQEGKRCFDNENVKYTVLNNIYNDSMLSESNGEYHLVWNYDGYMFKISGALTKDEIVALAESLVLADDFGECK